MTLCHLHPYLVWRKIKCVNLYIGVQHVRCRPIHDLPVLNYLRFVVVRGGGSEELERLGASLRRLPRVKPLGRQGFNFLHQLSIFSRIQNVRKFTSINFGSILSRPVVVFSTKFQGNFTEISTSLPSLMPLFISDQFLMKFTSEVASAITCDTRTEIRVPPHANFPIWITTIVGSGPEGSCGMRAMGNSLSKIS